MAAMQVLMNREREAWSADYLGMPAASSKSDLMLMSQSTIGSRV